MVGNLARVGPDHPRAHCRPVTSTSVRPGLRQADFRVNGAIAPCCLQGETEASLTAASAECSSNSGGARIVGPPHSLLLFGQPVRGCLAIPAAKECTEVARRTPHTQHSQENILDIVSCVAGYGRRIRGCREAVVGATKCGNRPRVDRNGLIHCCRLRGRRRGGENRRRSRRDKSRAGHIRAGRSGNRAVQDRVRRRRCLVLRGSWRCRGRN